MGTSYTLMRLNKGMETEVEIELDEQSNMLCLTIDRAQDFHIEDEMGRTGAEAEALDYCRVSTPDMTPTSVAIMAARMLNVASYWSESAAADFWIALRRANPQLAESLRDSLAWRPGACMVL